MKRLDDVGLAESAESLPPTLEEENRSARSPMPGKAGGRGEACYHGDGAMVTSFNER